mmetsp:Transcript_31233/g.75410  ORF Transcript_31233/g.75410 Transcript_31233/m.75410 type:complete len:230 (-) Transcript_31233:1446-2135(-)
MVFSTVWSNSPISVSLSSSLIPSRVYLPIHVTMGGRIPSASGGIHTTPSRETVAGEATERSSTSKRHFTMGGIEMRSPLMSVRSLLSSRTVFIDSIHRVSTGPSIRIHLRSGFSSAHASRMHEERVPSVHSRVTRLYSPNSSPRENALGLTMYVVTFSHPAFFAFLSARWAFCSVFHAVVLPVIVLPTSMLPCLHAFASYVWMTLRMMFALCWRLSSVRESLMAPRRSP